MKKSFFLGVLCAFCAIVIWNLKVDKLDENESRLLNWQGNILVRFDENGAKYVTINDGEVEDLEINKNGILLSYNEKKYIFVFLSKYNERLDLDIYLGGKLIDSIKLTGDLEDIKISPNGEYVLFKSKNSKNYVIFDVNERKSFELEQEVNIINNMIMFLDDGRIASYGVHKENKNGIALYNPKEKSYELIKYIEEPIIYIDSLKDEEILLLREVSKDKKEMVKLNLVSKKVTVLSDEVDFIDDGEYLDNSYYFIGKKINDDHSIYRLDIGTKRIEKLTFDFPRNINKRAGIEIINRRIYFTGYGTNIDDNNVYVFNPKDHRVTIINSASGKYRIIEKADRPWSLCAFFINFIYKNSNMDIY